MAHELVTLEQVKKHLRLPLDVTAEDNDLTSKLAAAQRIVLDYIADETDTDWTATMAAWDDETVPENVEAAILLMVGFLYHFRGDDPEAWKSIDHGNVPPDVKMCLYRSRKPVIA